MYDDSLWPSSQGRLYAAIRPQMSTIRLLRIQKYVFLRTNRLSLAGSYGLKERVLEHVF